MTQKEQVKNVAQMVTMLKNEGLHKFVLVFKDRVGRLQHLIFENEMFYLHDADREQFTRLFPVVVDHIFTNIGKGNYTVQSFAGYRSPRGEVV